MNFLPRKEVVDFGDFGLFTCQNSGENYQESESSVEYPLPMTCARKIYFSDI